MLGVAEDHHAHEEGEASGPGEGGLGFHLCGGGLQLGEDEESAGQLSWCRMSQGRSVPARGQSGPQLQALTYLKVVQRRLTFDSA